MIERYADLPPGVQDDVESILAGVVAAQLSQVQDLRNKGVRLTNELRPVFTGVRLDQDMDRRCVHEMTLPVYQGGAMQALHFTLGKVPFLRAWAQFPAFKPIMGRLTEAIAQEEIERILPEIFHCTFGATLVLELRVGDQVYILMGVRCSATAGNFSGSRWCMPAGGYADIGETPIQTATREGSEEVCGLLGCGKIDIHPVAGVALFADEPNTTFAVLGRAQADSLPHLEGGWEWGNKRMVWVPYDAVLADIGRQHDNSRILKAFDRVGVSVVSDLHIAPDVAVAMRELYWGLGLFSP